jgi:hypothetical protein
MTTVTDEDLRAFLAAEGRRRSSYAPSLDEVVGRLAPRLADRQGGASQRLLLVLAATLLLVAALGSAFAVGSGLLKLPLVIDDRSALADMWPQATLDEIREAQALADAGDPRYTWQIDPALQLGFSQPTDETEIVARFLREQLGWDEFRFSPIPEDGFGAGASYNNAYIRCAPKRTNVQYPDDPRGGGCAPTIGTLQYERVSLDLAQLARQGPSGIWVVSRWEMIEPFEQTVPPSQADVDELLDAFLQARIDGHGAERYVDVVSDEGMAQEVPLLYATATGARYTRYEHQVVEGPMWPDALTRVRVRLFGDGGTAVEQTFLLSSDGGRLRVEWIR